jgi:hypothetical protein
MAHSYRLKEMGIYHDMRLFMLPNNSFMLLKAELNDEQLMKCTYLKKPMLLTDLQQAVRIWMCGSHSAMKSTIFWDVMLCSLVEVH